MSASGGGVGGGMGEEPKTVLRVIIEHMLYPVTIDVLKQVGGAWAGTQTHTHRHTHTHTHVHTHTIDVLKQVGGEWAGTHTHTHTHTPSTCSNRWVGRGRGHTHTHTHTHTPSTCSNRWAGRGAHTHAGVLGTNHTHHALLAQVESIRPTCFKFW